jgi:hypothetical protein
MSRALMFATLLAGAFPVAASICPRDRAEGIRFGPHEENFIVSNTMRDRGWVERSETAWRGHLSVKYTFCGQPYSRLSQRPETPTPGRERKAPADRDTVEVFIAYTGEFDFYFRQDGRPSDPVINRIANPGLFVRVPTRRYWGIGGDDDNIVFSVEHRSNGQVADATNDDEVQRANRAYERRDRPYFDRVSRGSNQLTLGWDGTTAAFGGPVEFGVKLYWHFMEESEVRWGPLGGQGRSFRDYEVARLLASWRPIRGLWLDAQARAGRGRLRDTGSVTLGIEYHAQEWLPLYLRWHRGPFNTLSNYTQRQDSLGLGLRFTRF